MLRAGRGEIADRRTGIEKRHRLRPEHAGEIEGGGEIVDQAGEARARHFGGEFGQRRFDDRARHIHRHIAAGVEKGKPASRFLAIARAQIDQLLARARRARDGVAMRIEHGGFSAGDVILGQFADRLEQSAAQGIVKIFRADRGLLREQAGGDFPRCVRLRAAGDAVDD